MIGNLERELPKPSYNALQYSSERPSYLPPPFQFIASHTSSHLLAWVGIVGTDTGQATPLMLSITQLECTPKLPNVKYFETPRLLSKTYVGKNIAPKSSVNLITIAHAMHWFDLLKSYELVRWILKKPNGIITPEIKQQVYSVFWAFYKGFSGPSRKETTKAVNDKYTSIDFFPFRPVDGSAHTGPFEFQSLKVMSLDFGGLFFMHKVVL